MIPFLLLAGAGAIGFCCFVLYRRGLDLWFTAYLKERFTPKEAVTGPIHVMVCVADHFEPQFNRPGYDQECARVQQWITRYPKAAGAHVDADGVHPQHTFFYPEEEYRAEHLENLAHLCKAGFGDVEVHLHHDGDTAEGLREKLDRFKRVLYERHGLLRVNETSGEIEYAFIHGNWALDNSGEDGHWCGVNNELTVLRETGCYVDLTFPSAPSRTQPATINSIYYATDDPDRPKSHDHGIAVQSGKAPSGDLMLIQGPLTLNWKRRKLGLMPRIENGELSGDNPPSPERVDLWVGQNIHVVGRPEWIFIKLHTHGTNEKNSSMLLNGGLDRMWECFEQKYNDGVHYCLHYVTARELYCIVRAAEAGLHGNPSQFRVFQPTLDLEHQ